MAPRKMNAEPLDGLPCQQAHRETWQRGEMAGRRLAIVFVAKRRPALLPAPWRLRKMIPPSHGCSGTHPTGGVAVECGRVRPLTACWQVKQFGQPGSCPHSTRIASPASKPGGWSETASIERDSAGLAPLRQVATLLASRGGPGRPEEETINVPKDLRQTTGPAAHGRADPGGGRLSGGGRGGRGRGRGGDVRL